MVVHQEAGNLTAQYEKHKRSSTAIGYRNRFQRIYFLSPPGRLPLSIDV